MGGQWAVREKFVPGPTPGVDAVGAHERGVMQGSFWSFLSGFFAQLLAALWGVTSEPPPISFDLPAVDAFADGAGACTQGAFGLSRGEGARDVVCIGPDGLVSAMATDGSADERVSTTRLLFRRFEQAPAVADVDGDGHLDLVVLSDTQEEFSEGSYIPCKLAVLLGDGGGGFTPGYSSILPHACLALGSGDFDEDGAPDFVVPYGDRGSLTALGATLFLSRPGGLFEIKQYRAESASTPAASDAFEYQQVASDVLVFDADGDAHGDVVFVAMTRKGDWSVRKSGALHVLLGDGQGSFRADASRKLGMWGSWFSVTAADYDEDGQTDVAVAVFRFAPGAESIELPRILLGFGDGGFREPVVLAGTEASADLHSVDYDGDGHVDLITSGVDGAIQLYAGRGEGSFASPVGFSVGRFPQWITTLDFNLDGGLDLVAVTKDGLERFPLPPRQAPLGAPRVYSFILQSFLVPLAFPTVLADFEGDSDLDLVIGSYIGAIVLLNEGDAGFRALDIQLLPRNVFPSARLFAMGDVNRDGLIDVVLGRDPELRIYLQRADGTWEPQPAISSASEGQSPFEIALVDANGDGRLDIVERVGLYPFTSLTIQVQGIDGEFSPLPTTLFEGDVVKLEDANADGCFDVWASISGRAGIMIGDCAGGFSLEHSVAKGDPFGFEFVDMNIDGRKDFVLVDGILLANTAGGYDRTATLPGDYMQRVWVAELNGDGLPDVVLTDHEVLTLQGDGKGGAGPPQRVSSGQSYYAETHIGDLVGDELPDVMVISYYGASTRDGNDPYSGPPGTLVELTVTENISAH